MTGKTRTRAEHEAAVAEALHGVTADHIGDANDMIEPADTEPIAELQAQIKLIRRHCIEAMGESDVWNVYTTDSMVKELVFRCELLRAKTIEPAAAEPVGWVNLYHDGSIGKVYGTAEAAEESAGMTEYAKEFAVPLYRHPFDPVQILECAEGMSAYRHGSEGFIAYRKRLCGLLGVDAGTDFDCMNLTPMPRAVAPVGVVEELDELAGILEHYDKHQWALPIRRALARITELPPPDILAREIAEGAWDKIEECSDSDFEFEAALLLKVAAALLESAKEAES